MRRRGEGGAREGRGRDEGEAREGRGRAGEGCGVRGGGREGAPCRSASPTRRCPRSPRPPPPASHGALHGASHGALHGALHGAFHGASHGALHGALHGAWCIAKCGLGASSEMGRACTSSSVRGSPSGKTCVLLLTTACVSRCAGSISSTCRSGSTVNGQGYPLLAARRKPSPHPSPHTLTSPLAWGRGRAARLRAGAGAAPRGWEQSGAVAAPRARTFQRMVRASSPSAVV